MTDTTPNTAPVEAPATAGAASAEANPSTSQPAAAPDYDFSVPGSSPEHRPVFQDFARSVLPSVREEIAKSAASWLLDASKKTPPEVGDVVPMHNYNVSHSFQLEDTSELMSFLNEMQTRGAQQNEVDTMLDWYFDRSSRLARK